MIKSIDKLNRINSISWLFDQKIELQIIGWRRILLESREYAAVHHKSADQYWNFQFEKVGNDQHYYFRCQIPIIRFGDPFPLVHRLYLTIRCHHEMAHFNCHIWNIWGYLNDHTFGIKDLLFISKNPQTKSISISIYEGRWFSCTDEQSSVATWNA